MKMTTDGEFLEAICPTPHTFVFYCSLPLSDLPSCKINKCIVGSRRLRNFGPSGSAVTRKLLSSFNHAMAFGYLGDLVWLFSHGLFFLPASNWFISIALSAFILLIVWITTEISKS